MTTRACAGLQEFQGSFIWAGGTWRDTFVASQRAHQGSSHAHKDGGSTAQAQQPAGSGAVAAAAGEPPAENQSLRGTRKRGQQLAAPQPEVACKRKVRGTKAGPGDKRVTQVT
jgi:uncharacterized protein YfiM (DUF2279 family)